MGLVYLVITLGDETLMGSRNNLLGPSPSAELVAVLSNETQVTKDNPSALLLHARTEDSVPLAHIQMF